MISESGFSPITTPAAWVPLISRESLENEAVIEDTFAVGLSLVGFLEVGAVLDCIMQLYLRVVGDHLGQTVAVGVGDLEHAPDIANYCFRAQCAKGDDLSALLAPILVLYVLDDLASARLAEVDIEIGW